MNIQTKIGGARAGLSLMELMVLLGVMALVAMIFLPYLARSHWPAARINCVNNLKNVGLAFRIFATDNNDLFPAQVMASNRWHNVDVVNVYQWLSNELSTPKILICPKDEKREAANFATMTSKNVSYFASLSASETNYPMWLAGDRNLQVDGKAATGLLALTTNMALTWSKEIHVEQGNICLADGSVQQFANASGRLQQAVRDQNVRTNHLTFP